MGYVVAAKRFARPLLCFNPALCIPSFQFLSCAEKDRTKSADLAKSFLRSDVEMQGSIFSNEQLVYAKFELSRLLPQILPGWINAPIGEISKKWNEPNLHNVSFFIEIASIFQTLYQQSSSQSQKVLLAKMADLFQETGKQYDALLSELQAGYFLLTFRSQIEFERAVAKKRGTIGRPDYTFTLNNRRIYVDATRFRYKVLAEWKDAVQRSIDLIGDLCGLRYGGKVARITMPLECRHSPICRREAESVIEAMRSNAQAQLLIERDAGTAITVEWYTVPVVERDHPDKALISTDFRNNRVILSVSTGVSVIFESRMPLIQADELLYKAICNRANDKLRQFTLSEPFLLIIHLEDVSVIGNSFMQLLKKRIWPNPVYARLSGIMLLEPRTSFMKNGQGNESHGHFSFNEFAKNPIEDVFTEFADKTNPVKKQ